MSRPRLTLDQRAHRARRRILRRLHDAGCTDQDIADRMLTTRDQITTLRARMRLPANEATP